MRKTFESLFGWMALIGLLALPVVVLLALGAHRNIVRGKQVTMDRAKLSLARALEDYKATGGNFQTKRLYGYFYVYSLTNQVNIGGINYQCVLATDSQYQFSSLQSCLSITTNGVYVLLPFQKRSPQIIPNNYRVPSWQIGY